MPDPKLGLPFPIACPSYIYPEGWAGNLRRLCPRMDDVELLLFESDQFPGEAELGEVLRAAIENDCTLTIHLPADVFLGDPDPAARRRSIEAVSRAVRAVTQLFSMRFILHLDERAADGTLIVNRAARRDALAHSLGELRRHFSAGELCVENLNFPLSEDLPLIRQFELSVCLDIGHLIRDGVDVAAAVAEFAPYLGYVHLHGVADRDHRAVAVLGQDRVREIGRLLLAANYRGPVCLEVFNEKDLNESLACVRRAWAGLCWAGL